ncbi:NAD(P)H-binding protein [Maribellus comscasis]|uniref:NAD(P)H-binding protein n=1 Tax=Maribellus comscasis TaxID=2681766 RepID=A0A6I6JK70_9BACT|nr:NmrA family NAD(P)-binding protein [Maribellus comscasis]QGY42691.1 NAD(P)H-binding protein [Maribellus comscasis]
MKNKIIVVVGASGNQGREVVKNLLGKGFQVRTLTRNPKKIEKLRYEDNLTIFHDDLKNKDSLQNLMTDAYGLFFVLPPHKKSVAYGRTLIALIRNSNLKHVVFSSVGGVDRNSAINHFRWKKEIEDHLRQSGKPFTIVRPAGYMETFAHPKSIRLITGLLNLYINSTGTFQLISTQDIGRIVSMVFDNPQKYKEQIMEISGDELTVTELFYKLNQVKGIKMMPYRFPKMAKYFIPKSLKQMLVFYANDGWKANISELRNEFKGLLTFEDWLKTSDIFNK